MPKPVDIRAATRKALQAPPDPTREQYVKHLATDEGFKLIPRDLISPDPEQPRKHFDRESLDELAASLKEKGILQTLTVRPDPSHAGRFLVVAGERRWRAAGLIGLKELPCIIRTHPDHQEIALIENLQREDLTALEEAEALFKLKTAKGYTDKQLAHVIGKSRVSVTESLSLNELPERIKTTCRASDTWSKSQLLQVLRAGSPEQLEAAWEALTTGQLRTVRDLRAIGRHPGHRPKHLRLEYAPEGKPYRLTLIFSKKSTTRADVRAALKAALKDLPKQLHA